MDDTKKALLSIELDTAALTQNAEKAKATVAALADQLNQLKAAGNSSGEAFDKVTEQLKKAGEEAGKSKDALKEYSKGLTDAGKASDDLKNSSGNLAKQSGDSAEQTSKYSKTLKEYTADLVKAAENANPVAKSIGETAEKFKAFREITGQLGDAFTTYKTKVSSTTDDSKNFNNIAAAGAKTFETLKTGSEVATGGISAFSKALAGTGIGLIIIAVAALIEYLKQVTPVVDAVEKVTAGLTGGFNALGRIVMDLLSPLKKLFTDPKQAMKDLVDFLEQNVQNRFKAFGVIVDGLTHGNLKQFADGVLQLGTGVTNATDKIVNATNKTIEYSKAIVQAGIDTGKLKGQQQELARSVEGEALKAKQTEAEIAQLRNKAQTGNLAQRKAALAEIKRLETEQATLHKNNIENGVTLAIKDVAIKRALTQQEIELIKQKGATELKVLQDQGRIYADDVKNLSEALSKKYGLDKDYAEQTKKLRNTPATKAKTTPAPETKPDDSAKDQELRDQKELFDLKQAAAIKAAEKDFETILDLKKEQIEKDRNFELQQSKLTQTQKDLINERYNQQKTEAQKAFDTAKTQHNIDVKSKEFDDQLKLDEIEIDKTKNKHKQQLAAQLQYLKDKHDADVFSAQGNAKEITKIDAKYLADKKHLANEEQKLIFKKAQNYANHFSSLAGLFGKNTQASKAAFMAQKAIAAAEIAINTEKQVSASISATKNQIAEDSKMSFPLGTILVVKDIALGVIDVASTIANGVKQVASINGTNPSGFARGGLYLSDGHGAYLTGPGNGTSDSINAKLSNGESIINARSTQMFAPVLSAINQAGGGRAFSASGNGNNYALGGIFSGSDVLNDGSNELAQTRALNDMARIMAANMPRQILVVEDVQASLQNKAMLQSMSNF